MKVLVTGGAGFIGSHIVDRCVVEGYDIRVLDNLSNSNLLYLKKYLKDKAIEFVRGDIRDKETVNKCIKNVDILFHQAAQVSVPQSVKDPIYTDEVNVKGVLNLLIAASKEKIERFIYASSCSVYGDPVRLPVSENARLRPLSPYAASKVAGEAYCIAFHKMKKVPTTCLRYSNVFGSRKGWGGYASVIPAFIKSVLSEKPMKIFGDGNQTRDFIHVRDVVDANMLVMKNDKAVGEIFNIGSGKATKIVELLSIMKEITKTTIAPMFLPTREGDVRHSIADISKAMTILGYQPKTDLRSDLKNLFEDYRRL